MGRYDRTMNITWAHLHTPYGKSTLHTSATLFNLCKYISKALGAQYAIIFLFARTVITQNLAL